MSIKTYKQPFNPGKLNSLVFEMTKESGRIYTKALLQNKKGIGIKENKKIMSKLCKTKNLEYLQTQSAQASYESYFSALEAYFQSLKEFKKNPKKFSGEPKSPRKSKFMYKIVFKKTSIRRKNNELWFSTKKPNPPIKIKWDKSLPMPQWAEISHDPLEGWKICLICDIPNKVLALDKANGMSIDLGEKRTGTTFNGVNGTVKTYNGKILRSLTRLRNKIDGEVKSKKSKYKRGGRKYKSISKAKKRIVRRIKNQQNDILHKYSRAIVQGAIASNIGTILIGDNANTHTNTDLGKSNQKVQQSLEQKLAKFIEYKFSDVGGTVHTVPEHYTSRTCPSCGHIHDHSPSGRVFVCKSCGFEYERDGVGSIGIMIKNHKEHNVSFDFQKWRLNVVGGLTPPIGVKTTRLSPASKSRIIVSEAKAKEQLAASGLEEPHEL